MSVNIIKTILHVFRISYNIRLKLKVYLVFAGGGGALSCCADKHEKGHHLKKSC